SLNAWITQSRKRKAFGYGLIGNNVQLVIRVTSDIQPVPAPALSIARRGEELVDHLCQRIRRAITLETSDLRGAGRQADEIKIDAPQQHMLFRHLDGRQSFFFESRQYEIIDGRFDPDVVLHRRDLRFADWLK